jgi:hypothetical protein
MKLLRLSMHTVGYLSLVTATISLAGCVTANPTYVPDGRQGYAIDCGGEFASWGGCYEKAGAICGSRGYDVFNKSGDQGTSFNSTASGGITGSTTISRSMLIACKAG